MQILLTKQEVQQNRNGHSRITLGTQLKIAPSFYLNFFLTCVSGISNVGKFACGYEVGFVYFWIFTDARVFYHFCITERY